MEFPSITKEHTAKTYLRLADVVKWDSTDIAYECALKYH